MRVTAGMKKTIRNLGQSHIPENLSTKIEETPIDSKIPTKYYIVQSFPIYPQEFSNKGHKIFFDDGKWNVVLWPSNTSNFKDEVRFLNNAVDRMIDDIEATEIDEDHPENTELEMLTKKTELIGIALDELNRQITRENSERGSLMSKLLQLFSECVNDLSNVYNKIIDSKYNEHKEEIAELTEQNRLLSIKEKDAIDELKSQRILLDMQKQWHDDLETQIDDWKTAVRSFNDRLQSELSKQAEKYTELINDLQLQLSTATSERDGYKMQIDWEQKSLAEKDVEVLEVKKKLEETKELLEEREQTLYTTRAHFERQFMFMREQMGQLAKGRSIDFSNDNMGNLIRMLPPRSGEQLPFLGLPELNRRIMDIYTAKLRHDSAYPDGQQPPLFKFVVKYHIAQMYSYKSAVSAVWQFVSSCDRFKHESASVGIFVHQIEDETEQLRLIEYMALLTRRDAIGESGLPRLSVMRCVELGRRILPEEQIETLQRLVEKRIISPKRGSFVDFDIFIQILMDLQTDVHHNNRQRLMFQFRELTANGEAVDWPVFGDFVARFAPQFSSQMIGDLFLDAMRSSLPQMSVTESAFQLLVDNGTFEKLNLILSDEFEVANPEDVAGFVNMRWRSDIAEPVQSALSELKIEKMTECHSLFTRISRIAEHMKNPVCKADAATGLSQLHLAALLLVRYKFLKVARRDSSEAQKEIRRIVDIMWSL